MHLFCALLRFRTVAFFVRFFAVFCAFLRFLASLVTSVCIVFLCSIHGQVHHTSNSC